MKLPVKYAAVLAISAFAVPAFSATDCELRGPVSYICGVQNVEDLIALRGTTWILGSRFARGQGRPGGLYLIQSTTGRVTEPTIDYSVSPEAAFSACPSPPDAAAFGAHGISARMIGRTQAGILAVNHAGRESIEVFDLDLHAGNEPPTIRWRGCVVAPPEASLNAVTHLPGAGFAVTSFGNNSDKDSARKMVAGEAIGFVAEWNPARGWARMPQPPIAAPNGIVASPDGKVLYVAAWGDGKLHLIQRGGHDAASGLPLALPPGFHPDNIRWTAQGMLMIAGQTATPAEILQSLQGPVSTVPFEVIQVDPRTRQVTEVLSDAGSPLFGGASVAIPVGREIWIGSFRGDRIARYPAPSRE
jgi:hypothetical protein